MKEKRTEILYNYYCWNLKLIDTEKFYTSIKSLERYIYGTGIISGKEKITKMMKISLGRKKSNNLFNDLDPKFNVFKEKNKRHSYKGEEMLDADDIVKGNPIISTEATKRASFRRRLIKKRVKYREKQKKKKVILREELRMEEDGCHMPIKEVRVKEPPDKPKDELYKRSIKAAASTLYGITIASKNFQKTDNLRRTEKDVKNSDRSAGERKLESKEVEELYSFKTMLRMLYQAGIVILKEVSSASLIPYLSFPSSWIQFTGSLYQVQKNETEEASLIEVAECLILFEKFIKSRKMLKTSCEKNH
jgi:hypothetical protein